MTEFFVAPDRARVTVELVESGEKVVREIEPGEYLVVAVNPCYVDNFTKHATGTVQLTLKGHLPQKAGA